MVPIVVVLFLIAVYIMSGSSPFQYKCFLLTLENETLRRERFFKNHDWENTEDGMIIAGLNKMWNFVKNTETGLHQAASSISLVIFDEAHQSISPTYKLIIDIVTTRNPDCKFLGLTATPGRTWNNIDKDMNKIAFGLNYTVTDYGDALKGTGGGYASAPYRHKLLNLMIKKPF